ncbi:conserved membrane hypothetical protein [Gammaproteobacteria bacterium]
MDTNRTPIPPETEHAVTPANIIGRSKWWSWMPLTWPRQSEEDVEIGEIKVFTEQSFQTLNAQFQAIPEKLEPQQTIIREQIHTLLSEKNNQHWTLTNSHRVEQLLVFLYDADTVRTEFGRRLLEARKMLTPQIFAWYEKAYRTTMADRTATAIQAQRSLLQHLISDLQWRYTVSAVRHCYIKQLGGRVAGWFAVLTLSFVFALLNWQLPELATMTNGHLSQFIGMGSLAGGMGAAFSMLIGFRNGSDKSSLEDLKLLRSQSLIFARILVGVGAALVLLLLFKAGGLGGGIFPNLSSSAISETGSTGNATALLLLLWCFLAGFSEKLVPTLLAKVEGQIYNELPAPEKPGQPDTKQNPPGGDSLTVRRGTTHPTD